MVKDVNDVIIQLKKSITDGDLTAYKDIVDYYKRKNTEIFSREQLVNDISKEADAGNVVAMMTLYDWYQSGAYVETSEGIAIKYLKRIVNSVVGKQVTSELSEKAKKRNDPDVSISKTTECYINLVGEAYFQLGLYYLGCSSNEREISLARKYLQRAELCNRDCVIELGQVEKKEIGLKEDKPIGISPLLGAITLAAEPIVAGAASVAGAVGADTM